MRKSDNDRFNGWLRVHELLRPYDVSRPWVTVDPSCTYLARTMSTAMADKKDPDDVDTTGDDHALDALRYGAMSRPPVWSVTEKTAKVYPPNSWGMWKRWHARQTERQGALA